MQAIQNKPYGNLLLLLSAMLLVAGLGVLLSTLGITKMVALVLMLALALAIVAIIVYRHMWVGLALLGVAAQLNDLVRIPGNAELSVVKLMGGLLIALTILQVLRDKREFHLHRVGVPLMVFVGIFFLSSLRNENLLSGLVSWSSLFSYLALFLVVVNVVRDRGQVRAILLILTTVGGLVGVLAVMQYYLNMAIFAELLGRAGSLERSGAITQRVLGTANDPNAGALVPLLMLPVAISLIFSSSQKWQTWLLSLSAIFMVSHLLLSFSRSAWLGFIVGFGVLLWSLNRRHVVLIASLIALTILLMWLSPLSFFIDAVIARVTYNIFDNLRVSIFAAGLQMAGDHWLLGVGLGNFAKHVSTYNPDITKAPHSIPLAVLAQGGVFAFASFIWFFWRVFAHAVRGLRASGQGQDTWLIMGMLASVIGWQVMGFFNSYLSWALGWLMVSLLVVYVDLTLNVESNRPQISASSASSSST